MSGDFLKGSATEAILSKIEVSEFNIWSKGGSLVDGSSKRPHGLRNLL